MEYKSLFLFQNEILTSNRLHIIDSFRGVAALVVFFHHVYTKFYSLFTTKYSWASTVFNYISSLNVSAVLFFFFISGFSIALSVNGELISSNKEINVYLFKRFKRIIPLYILALVLTALCGMITKHFWINSSYNIESFIGNIFFLQNSKGYSGNWFLPYGNNGPLWSLSFEMWYYLFLPILLLLLKSIFKNKLSTIELIHLGLFVSWGASIFSTWLNKQVYLPWVAYLTLFILWYLGFWIGMLYKKNALTIKHLFFLLIITSTHIFLSETIESATLGKLKTGSIIATIFLLFYFLHNYFAPAFSIFQRVLNFLFNKIGMYSYALYLIHFPILLVCQKFYPDSYLALSITVISIFYFSSVFENWFRKQEFRFFDRNYLPIKDEGVKL